MSRTRFLVTTFVVAILAIMFSGTGIIQAAGEGGPVAEVYYGPEGIEFYPIVSYKTLVMSISFPNGQVVKRTYEGGKAPRISLGENYGAEWTDGPYTFQLRAIFEAEPQEELRDPKWEGIYMQDSLLQNGYFVIDRGSIVDRDYQEEGQKAKSAKEAKSNKKGPGNLSSTNDDLSTTQDVCYNDDLIVDGSLCVGFDCTCNYSFGFDTIVLKENNLRIFFDDTSVAASFPRNDWRIVINDSANGGAAYFGVEDSTGGRRVFTLEAGAPSHSLFVDDGGRVGFGTSTPSVELHTVDGDTPTLRLQQDGSSGFAPQTWDVAGNETNFFIRDVTNGSTLPFRIQPDSPSSSLTIRSTGNVGVGTWSPSSRFHVKYTDAAVADTVYVEATNAASHARIVAEQTGGAKGVLGASSDLAYFGSTNTETRIIANGVWKLQINTNGSMEMPSGATCDANGNWTPVSRRDAKENIKELDSKSALETVRDLTPVTYNYKNNKSEDFVGFIADDVPQLVAKKDRRGLTTMDIVAVLTKAVQHQQKTIDELKREIQKLKKRK